MNTIALRRIVAYLIDGLIIGIISSIVTSFIRPFFNPIQYTWWGMDIEFNAEFLLFFYLGYFVLFDFTHRGVTLGKLISGIHVVSSSHLALSPTQHVKRSLIKMISVVFSLIAFLVFIVTKNWTLHDTIAKTTTVSRTGTVEASNE
ncbi:RDD family protein [Altibacter sp. HG106]|uniref:RDD family protein n=1 Tax=Altibacter sp. HG106 TaxID=3023937 RepID=UPI00235045EF|nr:RDD family protein [Altibacter sp. HG106]MDC7994298.1 RDD family protein [Altibacter sp. HG106]